MAGAASKAQAFKKYTVQPQGFWGWVNKWLAVDPNRSTGIPLNAQFRNPPPGANDPKAYDDPVTLPAGDIADNPYWKRDSRRKYPRLSVVSQGDVVGLLSVGSKTNPREEVLKIGDAGAKQLVEVKEEGQKGLKAYFEKNRTAVAGVLGEGGMPPLPTSLASTSTGDKYDLKEEMPYGTQYPCRNFS